VSDVLAKLPQAEVEETVQAFVHPMTQLLSNRRLQRVVPPAFRGIIAGETPVMTAIARSAPQEEVSTWAADKGIYRFLDTVRFSHRSLFKGLYHLARQMVAQEQPAYVVIALDPVNFEKPYTQSLEGGEYCV